MSDIIEDLLSTYTQDQSRRVSLEEEAADEIQILRLQIKMLEAKNKKLAKALDEQYGTPCEQIRYHREIESLNSYSKELEDVRDFFMLERDQARQERDMCEQALSDRDASIEQMKELLAEARDDIHDVVINRYPFRALYPGDMRRYERDMDIVHRIDKALKDV